MSASSLYDAIAKQYDEKYVGHRWQVYDDVTISTLEPYLPPPGARILDAGAGSGKFGAMLLDAGYRVTMLDPSTSMLRLARERTGPGDAAPLVAGTIEALPFPDASFDFVLCEGDPLSYCVSTHHEAACELLRVLRPGAGFYVSVDNRWNAALAALGRGMVEDALMALETGRSTDPYGHPVHAFGPSELKGVLEAAGAVGVRVTGKIGLTQFVSSATLSRVLGDKGLAARFLDAERSIARDPTLAGVSGHLHAVGRAPGGAR